MVVAAVVPVDPGRFRPILAPSRRTTAIAGTPTGAAVADVLLADVLLADSTSPPPWIESVASAVGLVLGVPSAVAVLGRYAAANELSVSLPDVFGAFPFAPAVPVTVARVFCLSAAVECVAARARPSRRKRD